MWSLGVMAHEMCSGRSPFKGATAEATRANVLEVRSEPPDGASEALLSLLRRLSDESVRPAAPAGESTRADWRSSA